MLASSAFFVTLAMLVKMASDETSPMQAVIYRSVFSALPLLGIMQHKKISPASPRWTLLALRGGIGFLALAAYFFAVMHIQLANVLALQQLSPIFVSFLSVWLLGERPRTSHYLLAGVCLLGALLVIRPTRGFASLYSVAALVSAIFSSAAYVSVRALTRTEPTLRIVLWFSGMSALLSLPFALPGWRWPSLRANGLLIVAGLLAAPAQGFMTASYRRAQAHVAATFSYTSVPLGYLYGLLIWGERPDLFANIGIALIVVGGVLFVFFLGAPRRTTRRETTEE
jgi:drug/metabolite transporter (DMT)-like permease